jgi:signal-transduction protein with cAMP-binding, CBS, and nucleotidyltransferase domain
MLIDDLATRPVVTCPREATITAVAKLLATTGVGCVVVVDDDGRPVGICTDRDLVVRALAASWHAHTPVHCAMTEPVVTMPAGTDADAALGTMQRLHVRRVPMVAADGRVEGLVSLDDVTAMLATELDAAARIARPRRR